MRTLSQAEKIGLYLLAFTHLLAAYFSFGFHHPDEHYQILEFANYWAGFTQDSSALPWEFGAQIRPWFQPMIHGVVMKATQALGVYNPFSVAFFFRALYSALNIWGMWLLWIEMKRRFTLNPKWFLVVSLIWFFPYIHVRTSSENLAGIFITFAFAYYFKHQKYFWTGILFGFAFLARYQIALGIFGLGLYFLIRDRKITKSHLMLLTGFLAPVALGVVLDRIGYGNWVFTAYRYFKVNLVDGVAATFNPYPWYQYFIWILQLNPFISIPLFLGTLLYAKRIKSDELSFFVLIFFILHMGITNKEYRFLFPVLNLVIFMAVVGFQEMDEWLFKKKPFGLFAGINTVAFCVSSLHGASVQTLWPVHMANRYAEPGETWISNRDYLDQFSRGYYHLQDHHVIIVHTGDELERELTLHPKIKVLIDGQFQDPITQGLIKVVDAHSCKIITSSQPLFLFSFREAFPAINRLTYKAVYQCN